MIDNAVTGGVNLLDIDRNPVQIFSQPVASLSQPKQMLRSPDRKFVLIYDDAQFNLNYFSAAQESVTGAFALNYHTDSIVIAPDAKHAYAAVPNNPEQNAPPGVVLTFDLTTGASGVQVPVPAARRLAISNDSKYLMVFADASDTAYLIDATSSRPTAVAIAGFNRPYAAYFSSDNSKAYVLNCGTECDGSAPPSIQAVTISSKTVGTPVTVPGATVGLLDGSTLYLAGNDLTKPVGHQGAFTTFDVSGMAVKSSVEIADGLHDKIVDFADKYWVGSSNCSTTNCLSIVSGSTVTLGTTTGNVTALTPAPAKNWIYVMQGGELYQYDPASLSSTMPFDINGQGWDIALLDQ